MPTHERRRNMIAARAARNLQLNLKSERIQLWLLLVRRQSGNIASHEFVASLGSTSDNGTSKRGTRAAAEQQQQPQRFLVQL